MIDGNQARRIGGAGTHFLRLGTLATLSWSLLGACGSDDSQSSGSTVIDDAAVIDDAMVVDDPVEYTVLAEESEVDGAAALGIAVNEPDYRALWERAGFAEDPPPVDFGEQAVVIVTSSYGSGCAPMFMRLRFRDAEIEVQFVGIEPGELCAADENVHGLGLAINRALLSDGSYSVRAGGRVAELSLD